MKSRLTLAAVMLAACSAGSARAEDLHVTFNYADSLTAAVASLEASDNGDGSFTAFSGTLLVTGGSLDGLYTLWTNPVAPASTYSPSGRFIVNNQLHPATSSLLDWYGLLFVSPTREVNVWGNGDNNPLSMWGTDTTSTGYIYSNNTGAITFESSPSVPAPGAIGLATLGLCATLRRRR